MNASILAPLSGDFGALAALELMLVGAACGAIGVWVLQFGQAILAESFTHALLPGLVVASIVGGGLIFGALLGALLAYGLILFAVRAPHTSSPTGISAAVTTLVAVGALLAGSGSGIAGFEALLFGDPLAASRSDVIGAAALALLIAGALTALGRQFAALAFDPGTAQALGVRSGWISAAALALLALSVSVAANVAGSLLALALVTGPALGASAISDRLASTLWIAAGAGAACGLAGLYLSYYADWPASASIALTICAWAVLAGIAGARRGAAAQLG